MGGVVYKGPDRPLPLIELSTGKARFIDPELFPAHVSGYNRSDEPCTLLSSDDWNVVLEFLNEYKDSFNTIRSYTLIVERFMLWMILKKEISLSSIKRSHVGEYIDFMKTPLPASMWCGPKARKILKDGAPNDGWRPFGVSKDSGEGGVSDKTAGLTRKVLESLFNYLVDSNYLYGNPLTARRTKGQRSVKKNKDIERFLEIDEIAFVISMADELIQHYEKDNEDDYFYWVRSRYLFLLYLHTGMRISEPVGYTMGDLKKHKNNWSIYVQGKGDGDNEGRNIDLGSEFMRALKAFRKGLGLPILPVFGEKNALIPQKDTISPIGERRIGQIFRDIFDRAAVFYEELSYQTDKTSEEYSDHLRQASRFHAATCHWLRHSHATYFLELSEDLKATQERLGHADVGTTMIYLHTTQSKSKKYADKFRLSLIKEKDIG